MQVVRNLLKPKSQEAQVIVLYYSRAIRIIRLYHARSNDKAFLAREISALEAKLEEAMTPQARAKLRNNLRAVRAYMEIYGRRRRRIVARPRIYYGIGRVQLSASPDLAIQENGKLRLVKLGVTKGGDNPEIVRIMLRVMFQAARTRFQIEPRDVVYFDVSNALRIHGSDGDTDLITTIDNGCDALASMC